MACLSLGDSRLKASIDLFASDSGALVMASEYLSILNRINQSQAEQLKRNPKSHVAIGDLPLEIGLLNIAPRDGRVISSPDNGEQLMYAAVTRAVRFEDKPDFPDRAEPRDKRRHSVSCALAVWNQVRGGAGQNTRRVPSQAFRCFRRAFLGFDVHSALKLLLIYAFLRMSQQSKLRYPLNF